MITSSRVQEVLDYSEGRLLWKKKSGPRSVVGKEAGSIDSYGYRQITVDGVRHLAHKLVWLWHNKTLIPGLEFDHINRIRTDNRIENLQLITHTENIRISNLKQFAKTRPRENNRWIKIKNDCCI